MSSSSPAAHGPNNKHHSLLEFIPHVTYLKWADKYSDMTGVRKFKTILKTLAVAAAVGLISVAMMGAASPIIIPIAGATSLFGGLVTFLVVTYRHSKEQQKADETTAMLKRVK